LPYFHDAYKIWSCCQKKSTDFNTFLSIPGCTRGPHQPNKPQEPPPRPVEQETEVSSEPVIHQNVSQSRLSSIQRPSPDAPLVQMPLKVSPNLQPALDKLAASRTINNTDQETISDDVKPGTQCKHAACTAQYTTSDEEQKTHCRYHPGAPIFHEGLKFWSCCQKKTTDFEAFTTQPGCTVGEHLWRVPIQSLSDENDAQLLKSSCRYDFHQQGSCVVLTLYAKMPRPNETYVFLNDGRLKIDTRFGTDPIPKHFLNEWELYGLININQSTIELLPSKIEIILKKAEPLSWPRFDRPLQLQ